jgi:light-regulated signal transduction histidine kinase (bacteriophytochrome)
MLFPADAPAQQMFLCFVVGGMVAGAAGALSAQLRVFFAYAAPAILPLCARVVAERDELHLAMATMLLLFAAVMSVAAVRNRNVTATSIGLRFEKDNLLASLAEAKDRAESLNAVLEEQTRRLERVNSELRSFAYSVSHELRAPLRAIAGFSEVLLEDCAQRLDATDRDHLGRISRAAVQMARMIDGLLTLSRVTRGSLNRETVDLTAMAERVAAELREAEAQRRIEWSIAGDLVADCDAQLVQRVLENLLGNATKFTGLVPEALIEFGALAEEGRRTFFVRDNGAGFDMDHARQLFLPFHRLHRDSEFPGDGIGLATVQRIVQRHGGEIWADGAVGQGATFYFTLEPGPSSAA